MTKNAAECLYIIFNGNSLTNAAKCAIIYHVRNERMFALRKGNTMTNAMIILNESVRLMEEGKLKGTGETVKIIHEDGTETELEMPEPIHTFNGWKALGYVVKKGEKSAIKFPIWKYTEKAKPEEEKTGNPIEDAPETSMFMKMSAFFRFDQVEKIATA